MTDSDLIKEILKLTVCIILVGCTSSLIEFILLEKW